MGTSGGARVESFHRHTEGSCAPTNSSRAGLLHLAAEERRDDLGDLLAHDRAPLAARLRAILVRVVVDERGAARAPMAPWPRRRRVSPATRYGAAAEAPRRNAAASRSHVALSMPGGGQCS